MVKLAANHQGTEHVAMLLPQNTTMSKADSSLSISMRLSTPDAVPRLFVRGTKIGILAAALTVASLTSVVSAAPADSAIVTAGLVGQSWTGFTDWIAASYARAPALVLGLGALLLVPPLALIGLWARRSDTATATVSEAQTQVQRIRRTTTNGEPRDTVRTGHIPLRPLQAWVEVVNAGEAASEAAEQRYSLARTLLRIGRETDNDICLSDKTVHRYHAAIHRTEDAEFVITDLSSAGGNGVVVNGRAVAEARLASGDMIELGKARLKFSAGSPG